MSLYGNISDVWGPDCQLWKQRCRPKAAARLNSTEELPLRRWSGVQQLGDPLGRDGEHNCDVRAG